MFRYTAPNPAPHRLAVPAQVTPHRAAWLPRGNVAWQLLVPWRLIVGQLMLLQLIVGQLMVGRCAAQQAVPDAYLVRVPVPIVGTADQRLMRTLDRILAQIREKGAAAERPTIVLEFWPPEDPAEGAASEFERCLALARYLVSARLDNVRTVAYLPRSTWGHAVLPIMACEQIVMHPEAELGNAGMEETSISPAMLAVYREVAERRRTIPPAVAIGFLDRRAEVYKVTTDRGVRFELKDRLAEVRREEKVQAIDTLIPAGDMGRFNGRTLRLELGLVSHLASDRKELAALLEVRAASLEPDPSLGEAWIPIRIDLDGIVSDVKVDRAMRMLEEQIRSGRVNFVCLYIDSPGGAPAASLRLAGYLAELDGSRVRTVAYIARQALADAALVAGVCDQVVLQRGAVWGGPGSVELSDVQLDEVGESFRAIAKRKGRYWSPYIAMFDPRLEVTRYQLADRGISEFWTEEEWKTQADPDRWKPGEVVSAEGEHLRIEAEAADMLGLVDFVADGFDDLKAVYQLKNDPHFVRPGWADEFVEFLASPQIAFMLLFFAGFALMAELSTPGLGAGGFVSAVCFVLFFWSQFLHGTATWLEILLFLTGAVCVLIELLVLPGIGIFGIGGGLLIIGSLVLASQTFVLPRNPYQVEQLSRSLLTVMAGGAGVVVGFILLRRFLYQAPFFRQMALLPPDEQERRALDQREQIADRSALLGEQGVAATSLMLAGKGRFGNQWIDVVSDGDPIEKGTPIEVIEVRAHRVLVRALRR